MSCCEKCKACVERHHKCKGCKCGMCSEQMCNVNQHQCFLPMISKSEAGQGDITYGLERMQETGTHEPNDMFAKELALDAAWDVEEGAERKTEGEWELKGDTCLVDFICLFTGTKSGVPHFPNA